MPSVNPKYITDKHGNKISVVLSLKEFDEIIEALEELHDVHLYDEAKGGQQEFIDADQAFQEIEDNRSKH